MNWIVAVSKPRQEAWGAENIRRQGFEAYYPRFEEEYITRKHQVATRVRCLFPRYMFVQTDGQWHFLLSTFGMAGVVREGEEPATIPTSEITRLKASEDETGVITLPPKPEPIRYVRGQKLRITYGPMCGLTGICQGDNARERVRVLMEFLGRKSPVLLARDALIAA